MIQRLKSPTRPTRNTRLKRWWTEKSTAFSERRRKRNKPKRNRTRLQSLGWQVDKLLSVAAPVRAARRMESRYKTEHALARAEFLESRGFSGARNDDFRSSRWSGLRGDIDSLLDLDLQDLQTRCGELARDNIIARSAIEGRKTNEVGTGINCQPTVMPVSFPVPGRVFASPTTDASWISEKEAEAINISLRSFCEQWSQYGVDKSRQFTLPQFQRQVVGELATYGEAFVLFGDAKYFGPTSFAMELVHPQRVETPPEMANDPSVRLGVKYDEDDCVTGYYVRSRHPGDHKEFSIKYDFFPRYDPDTGQTRMCHIFEPQFAGQSRAIPWLAWVMNRCKDLDDYWEAELINKQVEACFGIAVTGGSESGSPMSEANSRLAEPPEDGKRIEELSPAGVNYFSDGAQVTTIDPQRPGATFAPFIELSLRSIAAALNYPYELLAKNFFRTTYSSGRLAMLDGRMGFRVRTQMLIDMWLCHVHRRLVYDAMITGYAPIDVVAYQQHSWMFERHSWRGQNRGLLDPEKENKGHAVGLENEIETRTAILVNRGETLDDNEQELLQEGKRKIDREIQLRIYREQQEAAKGLEPGSSLPGDEQKAKPEKETAEAA